MRLLRENLIGWVAIFVALGGIAYAGTLESNSVKSKHIKDGQVRSVDVANDTSPHALTGTDIAAESIGGADVSEAGLDSSVLQSRVTGACPVGQSIRQVAQNGTVTCETDDGSATLAAGEGLSLTGNAFSVSGCSNGQIRKRVSGSWTCASDDTTPSGAAGGDLAGTYPNPTLRPADAKHYVGEFGEPSFQNGWNNFGGFHHKASFYKDRAGVVHLSGIVSGTGFGTTAAVMFTLPAAYRPCGQGSTNAISNLDFPAISNNAFGIVHVNDNPDGAAVSAGKGSSWIALDGVTWRAEGC